jgi:hypothetical protein
MLSMHEARRAKLLISSEIFFLFYKKIIIKLKETIFFKIMFLSYFDIYFKI